MKKNMKTALGAFSAVLAVVIAVISVFTGCAPKNEPETTVTVSAPSNAAEGTQAVKEAVSADRAKLIALDAAGVQRDKAVFTKARLDEASAEYELEFTADGYEYEYDISVETGEILHSSKERLDNPSTTARSAEPTTEGAETTEPAKSVASDDIGLEAAKSAALSHAGVSASEASFTVAGLSRDRDDIAAKYDIEFTAGSYEYDYEILASNGRVIDFEKERIAVTSVNNMAAYIGVEAAKAIALEDAQVAEKDASFKKAKMDSDDGIMKYEIEFTDSSFEYEYEINALTGKIIEKDKEFGGF